MAASLRKSCTHIIIEKYWVSQQVIIGRMAAIHACLVWLSRDKLQSTWGVVLNDTTLSHLCPRVSFFATNPQIGSSGRRLMGSDRSLTHLNRSISMIWQTVMASLGKAMNKVKKER